MIFIVLVQMLNFFPFFLLSLQNGWKLCMCLMKSVFAKNTHYAYHIQVKLAPLLRTRKKRRKKRRKKNLKQHQHPRNLNLLKSQMLLMKPYLLNLNQRTHLMPCPKELSTLKISNDSTPTTMKPFPSPTSGRSSTRRTILSGLENTNTMKS